MDYWTVVVAILIGVFVWRISLWTIRMLSIIPPEVDPDDVVPTTQHFRCSICGTEVTMTASSVTEAAAPKHCREEMDEVPT